MTAGKIAREALLAAAMLLFVAGAAYAESVTYVLGTPGVV